ncbi:MAG: hypothetical protein JRD94_14320 [Deltaproteobacteria bacterium]|nr:hypothetical protein [Deltaproteobacteria bacterium]
MVQTLRVCVFAGFFLTTSAAGAQARQDGQPAAAAVQDEGPGLPVLVMLIGGGARFRNIHFNVGGTEQRTFDTSAYFDFGWHLLIRPVARRSPRPAVQAIAIQIDGGSGIGLDVEPAGTGISLQTNTWRLLGQFGYLYPIDRLQVGGLVGVGGDVFSIDLNSVLPSSRIIYVRLGPAVAYTSSRASSASGQTSAFACRSFSAVSKTRMETTAQGSAWTRRSRSTAG